MIKLFVIPFLLLLFSSANAENFYWHHAEGWHWYDDPKEKVVKKNITESAESSPEAKMSVIKKSVKNAMDKAILDPTPENVESYIDLQNQVSSRAQQFANTWQNVLLQHPELNFSIGHPTNGVALQVFHDEESKQYDDVMAKFAKQSGLFFFYRSTCPYCKRFAPILKNFAARYGISVIPITLDGIALPEFPQSRTDSGQADQFHVTVEPSLFAVNPYTQKAFPVAYGLTSESELRENIYKIVSNNQG